MACLAQAQAEPVRVVQVVTVVQAVEVEGSHLNFGHRQKEEFGTSEYRRKLALNIVMVVQRYWG